jgi:hypothetical protein
MSWTIRRRSCVAALTVSLLVIYSALMLGLEIGVAVGLHIARNMWLDVAGGVALFIVPAFLYIVMCDVDGDRFDVGFFGGLVVGACVLGVATGTYQGLDDRVLYEHGRQVQAIVSYVYWQGDGSDPGARMAAFTDLSGRPVPGELSGADSLKVGQRVVVTVDPAGKVPMVLGTPTGSGDFRIAKISGGIEVLTLVWPAYRGAVVLLRTKKPRKPLDPQGPQDLPESLEPQGRTVSDVVPIATIHETGDVLDGRGPGIHFKDAR